MIATERAEQLNEAVNFDLRVIFVAVPKNATTSIRSAIKPTGRFLFPTPHLDTVQIKNLLITWRLYNGFSRNDSFPSTGVETTEALIARARDDFRSFFKFATVRNPWSRAVSLYQRRQGIQLRDRITFEEFCRQHRYASDTCLHPTLHRDQLDWLIDEDGRMAMDCVFKIEAWDEGVRTVAERSDGRVRLPEVKLNRNPVAVDYRDLYNDETRTLVARAFERDIDTFQYTF